MKPATIEIPYNGEKFFIDIADGNMVNLNKLHELSGATQGRDPREWSRLPSTKKLIKTINVGLSPLLKKRGIGGGTWAHWQLALSYAQYLSPELHLAVNHVFKERLEEAADPELGINRSIDRATKKWKDQGHDDQWIADRSHHVETRKFYVDTLLEHDVKPNHEIGICTNGIYKGLFNKDAAEIEEEIRARTPGLPRKINIRDHAKRSSIAAIGLSEALAAEEIEDFDVRGVDGCTKVSFEKGLAVQGVLSSAKKKSPAKLSREKSKPEDNEKRIKALKDALKLKK